MLDQVRLSGIKKAMRDANEIKNEVDAGKMVATEAFRSLEAEKMATTIAVKIGIKRR